MEMEIELLELEVKASEPTTALTVQDRAALALASSKTRTDLIALAEKSKTITEIKNKAGRDECHSAAMKAADARILIAKTGKAARDDATKFSKAVIAEENSLIALIEPEEKRLLGLRDAWDAKIAAEKAERERIERERVLAITQRIADLRGYVALALECRTAERVQALLESLTAKWMAFDFEADFEEFGDEAQQAFDATKARLQEVFEGKQAEEAERARIKAEQEAAAARLAAERAELDRQRAEQAERERLAAEARAKEEAEAQARRDAETAELQRQREAFEAEQAAARAKAQRLQDERDAEDARLRAAWLEGQQALAEQRAALERKQAEAAPAEEVNAVQTEPPAPIVEMVAEPAPAADESSDEASPTDDDVIAVAARALCDAFGWSLEYAIGRLGAIQDWSAA